MFVRRNRDRREQQLQQSATNRDKTHSNRKYSVLAGNNSSEVRQVGKTSSDQSSSPQRANYSQLLLAALSSALHAGNDESRDAVREKRMMMSAHTCDDDD